MSIDWQTVAEDFAFDGGLRDIYILHTDATGWQRALETIRATATDLEYRCGDEPAPLPSSFGTPHELGRLLAFSVGKINLACHFFHDEIIEFDFWPSDLSGQADLDDLVRFLQRLGDAVGQPVIVCPENSPEHAFLRYDPESHAISHLPFQPRGNP